MKDQALTEKRVREIVREEIAKERQEFLNSFLKFREETKITDTDLEEIGFK